MSLGAFGGRRKMGRAFRGRKDLKALRRKALDAGWRVGINGSGHVVFKAPSGETIIMPFSPSDRRAKLNARARLRRAGLEV